MKIRFARSLLTWILLSCFWTEGFCQKAKSSSFKDKKKFGIKNVEEWASKISREFRYIADTIMKTDFLIEDYRKEGAIAYKYRPDEVLGIMARRLTNYLDKRKTLADSLKQSMEHGSTVYTPVNTKAWKCFKNQNKSYDATFDCLNELSTRDYRFVDTRPNGESEICSDPMFNIQATPNPNFYNFSVDTSKSAVHVPVPVFKYDPSLLEEIYWTGKILDKIFRERRAMLFTAANWQFYCSPDGFMRFYPGMNWRKDHSKNNIDFYDCRTSEWFIDGATSAKNILIVLDMSGSMFGQRYEIAKHTIQFLLDTLSENDFFNIIKFSQNATFLIPCFNRTVVQATLRNKHLMKEALGNSLLTPEGFAQLEETWRLVGETLKEIENKTAKFGCNTAIMLITDASADFQLTVFDEHVKPHNVRLFSLIIGNDVSESQARVVEKMACANHGSRIRIHNLADAQQKVQSYIEIMSRSIAQRDQNRAIWTGSYYDHQLSQTFVATVAFAVVTNSTFRGVVGASSPITALEQMAAVYMVGANAYSFLVDNNGFVMFHPQLRPFDTKKRLKPNSNSMDIMELEVLQINSMMINDTMVPIPVDYNHPLRKSLANGKNSEIERTRFSLDVFFAVVEEETIKRIYKQTNDYYYRSINGTLMTLGLAVPPTSEHLLDFKDKASVDPSAIDLEWFKDKKWRLHPNWQYCQPNDTNNDMTKEEVFVHYMKQYKDRKKTGSMPEKCESYKYLIERLLRDAKVTSKFLETVPDKYELSKGIHAMFIATQSGLTRYKEFNIDGLQYEPTAEPVYNVNDSSVVYITPAEDRAYLPFLQKYNKGIDEAFYRRSTRTLNSETAYVVDVDLADSVYFVNDSATYQLYGARKSPLITIMTSIELKQDDATAIIGVQGLEVLYVSLAAMFKQISDNACRIGGKHRCYLIDENGYIVYTSVSSSASLLEKYYLGHFFGHSPMPVVPPTMPDDFDMPSDFLESYAFNKLVEYGYYENLTYIDYQSVCVLSDFAPTVQQPVVSSVPRLMDSFLIVMRILLKIIHYASELLSSFLLCTLCGTALFHTVEPSASGPRDAKEVIRACDKWSPFYLLNRDKARKPIELFNGKIECLDEKSSCTGYAYAAPVNLSNLLLIVIRADSQCSLMTCLTARNNTIPYFEMKLVNNATDKFSNLSTCENNQFETRYRRSPSVCYAADDDRGKTCSSAAAAKLSLRTSIILITAWWTTL